MSITTAAEIKTALVTALTGRLGTYTFSGGQTTSAVRIDDGSDPYDEEPAIAGLELVIVPSLEITMRQMIGGWQDTYSTTIVLKQWDIERTTLPERSIVMQALAQFPTLLVTSVRRVVRSNKLDNIETMTIGLSEAVLEADVD